MDTGLPFPYNTQENCVLFDLETVKIWFPSHPFGSGLALGLQS